MKKLKFESNGSTWLLLCANNRDDYYLNARVIDNPNGRVGNGVSLCKITYEQVQEVLGDYSKRIVQEYDGSIGTYYINHLYHPIQASHIWYKSALESLYSLFKSKGVYLYKNPYQDDWDELCTWGHGCFAKDGKSSFEIFTEAESNTFYNPVLFKIINDDNRRK